MDKNDPLTSEERDYVEKMFTRYIHKSVIGIKLDYYRKILRIADKEICSESLPLLAKSASNLGSFDIDFENINLSMAMEKLTDKQLLILKKIYAYRFTEREVGMALGIRQQTVHYHKNKALKKLTAAMSIVDGKKRKPSIRREG